MLFPQFYSKFIPYQHFSPSVSIEFAEHIHTQSRLQKSPKSEGLSETNGCRIPPLDPGGKCGTGGLGNDMENSVFHSVSLRKTVFLSVKVAHLSQHLEKESASVKIKKKSTIQTTLELWNGSQVECMCFPGLEMRTHVPKTMRRVCVSVEPRGFWAVQRYMDPLSSAGTLSRISSFPCRSVLPSSKRPPTRVQVNSGSGNTSF